MAHLRKASIDPKFEDGLLMQVYYIEVDHNEDYVIKITERGAEYLSKHIPFIKNPEDGVNTTGT